MFCLVCYHRQSHRRWGALSQSVFRRILGDLSVQSSRFSWGPLWIFLVTWAIGTEKILYLCPYPQQDCGCSRAKGRLNLLSGMCPQNSLSPSSCFKSNTSGTMRHGLWESTFLLLALHEFTTRTYWNVLCLWGKATRCVGKHERNHVKVCAEWGGGSVWWVPRDRLPSKWTDYATFWRQMRSSWKMSVLHNLMFRYSWNVRCDEVEPEVKVEGTRGEENLAT